MDVSGRFLAFTLHGAGWVLWMLIALSVMSMAVMLERLWYFRRPPGLPAPAGDGDSDAAAGVRHARGARCAHAHRAWPRPIEMTAAIEGVKTRERLRLERRLPFLATLGSNGPFVGLFGTVLGIIKAFHNLAATAGTAGAGASTVMAGISEALVATAIGLLVAIPAVVAFNYFSRRVRVRMAEVDWMAHLAAEDVQAGWAHTGEHQLRRSA